MERPETAEYRDRLFELSIDMLGVAGVDGYFKHLSKSWEAVLGFSRDELLAQPYLAFVHPEDQERTRAVAAGLAAGTSSVACFENRYRCKDGSYRWIEWNSSRPPEQALTYFIARDLTRRREAERVAASQERLGALLAALPHFVALVTRDARMLFVNRVAAGLTVEQVLGATMYEFTPPEYHGVMREKLAEAWDTGKPTRYEMMAMGLSGGTSWYASQVVPILREGEIIVLALTSEEITERKLAEQERERLEAELRDAAERQKLYAEELEEKNLMLSEENTRRDQTERLLRQQQETMLAMSTPIIQAWEGVLALPVIGNLDAARAAQMMERLLSDIARTRARFAILDLTGVSEVDASTVSHLVSVVRATSLLGSRCLVSGISPSIAQTMVELGDLGDAFLTFGLFQDALRHALLSSGIERPARAGAAARRRSRSSQGR